MKASPTSKPKVPTPKRAKQSPKSSSSKCESTLNLFELQVVQPKNRDWDFASLHVRVEAYI